MDSYSALKARIEEMLRSNERVLVAVDGMAASGKTTLATALCRAFPRSAVVHMDDFTIPFEDRAPGYFEAQLSNADVVRFDREVLTPLLEGQEACYRPYVCHPVPGFLEPVRIAPKTRLIVIEGAYCLHPLLFDRYDLRVLSLIDPQAQRMRILARNGEAQLARFESLWIPMENRHIEAHSLRRRCDMTLFTDQAT